MKEEVMKMKRSQEKILRRGKDQITKRRTEHKKEAGSQNKNRSTRATIRRGAYNPMYPSTPLPSSRRPLPRPQVSLNQKPETKRPKTERANPKRRRWEESKSAKELNKCEEATAYNMIPLRPLGVLRPASLARIHEHKQTPTRPHYSEYDSTLSSEHRLLPGSSKSKYQEREAHEPKEHKHTPTRLRIKLQTPNTDSSQPKERAV